MPGTRIDCGHCGYDMTSLAAANAAAVCPECGVPIQDRRVLAPWPSKGRLLWDLMRVQTIAVGSVTAVAGLVALAFALRVLPLVEIGCTFATVFLAATAVACGLALCWPPTHASTIARRHVPDERFWRAYFPLLLIGWALSFLLVAAAAVAIFYLVRVPFRIMG